MKVSFVRVRLGIRVVEKEGARTPFSPPQAMPPYLSDFHFSWATFSITV